MEVEAVMGPGATAPIVGQKIAKYMGVWRYAKKIHVKQGDGSNMKGGKFVVNSYLSYYNKSSKYPLDAEVFNIGPWNMIIGLSWLQDQGFSFDIPKLWLINNQNNIIILCCTQQIPSISIIECNKDIILEEGDILIILDISERYADYAQVFLKE